MGKVLKTNFKTMIWINLKKLEKKLRENTLSEELKIIYFLIFILALGVPLYFNVAWDYTSPQLRFIDFWIFLGISLVEILLCYKVNNILWDAKDFFGRYFSLSFVISLRYILPLSIILFIVFMPILWDGTMIWPNEIILTTLIYFIYIYLLLHSYKRVNGIDTPLWKILFKK